MKDSLHTYWVLVADGGRARIFELRKTPAEFQEVHTMASEALHSRSVDLVADGSGRSFNTQGPASHSKQQKSDPHELAEQAFSRKVIDKLERAANMNVFEKLMVVSDPRTMGRLRSLMSKQLRNHVTCEVNLDLVGLSLEKLEKRVLAHLGWAG